jgi:hypothetical protein
MLQGWDVSGYPWSDGWSDARELRNKVIPHHQLTLFHKIVLAPYKLIVSTLDNYMASWGRVRAQSFVHLVPFLS